MSEYQSINEIYRSDTSICHKYAINILRVEVRKFSVYLIQPFCHALKHKLSMAACQPFTSTISFVVLSKYFPYITVPYLYFTVSRVTLFLFVIFVLREYFLTLSNKAGNNWRFKNASFSKTGASCLHRKQERAVTYKTGASLVFGLKTWESCLNRKLERAVWIENWSKLFRYKTGASFF